MSSREARWLWADVAAQQLHWCEGGQVLRSFPMSSARNGLGEVEGSLCTPRGWHRVAEVIGAGEPEGRQFISRKPVDRIWRRDDPPTESDLILTRILWLEGLEPHNANTRARYIYIHGTNQEHLLGSPASHGCLRVSNRDALELAALVPTGSLVWIGDGAMPHALPHE